MARVLHRYVLAHDFSDSKVEGGVCFWRQDGGFLASGERILSDWF